MMPRHLDLYLALFITNADLYNVCELYVTPQTLFESLAYDLSYNETLAACASHRVTETIDLCMN
jgi:hypothetical protein